MQNVVMINPRQSNSGYFDDYLTNVFQWSRNETIDDPTVNIQE